MADPRADKDTRANARDELKNVEEAHLFVSPGVELKADDGRLHQLVQTMLADYPLLTGTVNLWWVNDDQSSLSRIAKMEERLNVEPELRITGINWSALSHYPHCLEHFIFIVKNDWADANDEELKGVLAHELTHEEWKETGMSTVIPDPSFSALSLVCNERITDLITISKGYGEALLLSRRYQERTRGTLENTSIMTPFEIERIIQSEFVLRQNVQWQRDFTTELALIICNSDILTEEYQKEIRLWQKVIEINPDCAPAYYEQGTVYYRLNELAQAESCYRKAFSLEPYNPVYKGSLDKILADLKAGSNPS